MRAYFWGNMYLSSIQQGIQPLHCVSEMFMKYEGVGGEARQKTDMLYSWAKDYKTVVVLNAGEGEKLERLWAIFDSHDHPYPWAHWNESREALNGAITSVGIILPERVYEGAREIKKNWRDTKLPEKMGFSEFEQVIIKQLNSTYMAR